MAPFVLKTNSLGSDSLIAIGIGILFMTGALSLLLFLVFTLKIAILSLDQLHE